MRVSFKGGIIHIIPETQDDILAMYEAGFRDGGDIGLLVCQVAPGTEQISHLQCGGKMRSFAKGGDVIYNDIAKVQEFAEENYKIRIATAKGKQEPVFVSAKGVEVVQAALQPKFVDPDAKPAAPK